MHFSPMKKLFSTTALLLTMTLPAYAADLPTGGEIVAGSGAIAQSGNAMTVTQDTAKMAANWDSFSIGQNHSVNFVQPSSDAVALNRVLGSDVSVIQGALNANGHVFLINPNGVTFSPDAQINVGGLVASTQGISTQDFMDGNYTFEGTSSSAIVNQGNITAASGGTIALIAAHIINEGTIEASEGDVLMGAGNKVTLDLGGPVKIEVTEGAIDTLIEQGGAVRADGGLVYLTAKAAGELAISVINHTGITQAQTLSTGEDGEIILLGDMDVGTVNVVGTLDASAPNGGDGGFIETSAAHVKVADGTTVTTLAEDGVNGEWLIDPNDFTVAASGGDITGTTLATNLGGGDVTIQTTGAGGNLYVNDAVAWAANKLTLNANNNILINNDLIATGTGSLAFEYGQDSADGAGSSYSVADGVDVLIPDSSNFTWKKGSGGDVNNLWFGNDYLEFDDHDGEDFVDVSDSDNNAPAITDDGTLEQPYYYDDGTSGNTEGWYKLTYDDYPLDIALGSGGDGTSSWNLNGRILATDGTGFDPFDSLSDAINYQSINIAGYTEGTGTLVSTINVDVVETGSTVDIINKYMLGADDSYIKTITTVKNNSGATPLTNVRLWVGTRDDYIAESDSNYKTKGNLGDGFRPILTQTEQAKAIKISTSDDDSGTAILFYSTSDGANGITCYNYDFDNTLLTDPETSDIETGSDDGSYAMFLRMNDLAAGASESLVWYYAAGQASEIDNIADSVAQSAGVYTPPTPTPTPTDNTIPEISAVTTAQAASNPPTTDNTRVNTVITPQGVLGLMGGTGGTTSSGFSNSVGSMDIVELSSADFAAGRNSSPSSQGSSGEAADGQGADNGGNDENGEGGEDISVAELDSSGGLFGPTKVFVVDGGVRLPSGVPSKGGSRKTKKR